MKIGEKIRNAREDLDLSQEEVSAQIPMNQSSYSKIERDLVRALRDPGLRGSVVRDTAFSFCDIRRFFLIRSRFGAGACNFRCSA